MVFTKLCTNPNTREKRVPPVTTLELGGLTETVSMCHSGGSKPL